MEQKFRTFLQNSATGISLLVAGVLLVVSSDIDFSGDRQGVRLAFSNAFANGSRCKVDNVVSETREMRPERKEHNFPGFQNENFFKSKDGLESVVKKSYL